MLPKAAVADFDISRGVNISHWLSQSSRRGEQRRAFFTEQDVQFIAGLGYDHVRLPVDEEQLWDERGNRYPEAFELMNNAIAWSKKHGLRVVVDLHILRSHHFNAKDKPLWTDPKAQERFIELWRDLSKELKRYPTDRVAYELMNEPVADDPEDWNRLVAKLVATIRETEPARKIVIGSNKWQSAHYTASWTGVGRYKGPVSYPGRLVDPAEIEKLPADVARMVKGNNGVYDRQTLRGMLEKPLAAARKYGLPLYCGEWGCIKATPEAARLAWYADVRSILEENGIAWANWDYKGGFGILTRDGGPDQKLIDVLTKRPR
jgi:endoglucanase